MLMVGSVKHDRGERADNELPKVCNAALEKSLLPWAFNLVSMMRLMSALVRDGRAENAITSDCLTFALPEVVIWNPDENGKLRETSRVVDVS